MRMKRMLGTITMAIVASGSGSAVAATAYGPTCDPNSRVSTVVYFQCTSSSHVAIDMDTPTCAGWNHRSMLEGSFYYTYHDGGCANSCSDTSCANYFQVTGANGWDFRQMYLWSNANTFSKTCDGCTLGLTRGTHVHADNRQYATRKSAWLMGSGITCGRSAYCGNVMGYPTL